MKENKDTLLYKGRRRILAQELESSGLYSKRVLKAIGAVPRHLFVQQGLEEMAYKDIPVAIEARQTISQPSTVALQTQLLEFRSGDKILEIGTGCGYQSAVLFYLGADVYTVERQEELFWQAARNLSEAGYLFAEEQMAGTAATKIESGKLHLYLGDGFAGLEEEAPFDGIVVTCGAPDVPPALLRQLKTGGRLVIPVDEPTQAQKKKNQILKIIVKTDEGHFKARNVSKMSFVPMLKGIEKSKLK